MLLNRELNLQSSYQISLLTKDKILDRANIVESLEITSTFDDELIDISKPLCSQIGLPWKLRW